MTNNNLEIIYENVILPRYSEYLNTSDIHWTDHGRVDDSYVTAHYFESDGQHYILLSNNYANGTYLDDGISHEIIKCGDKTSIELNFSDNYKIENVTGKYTLYREKKR
jgi:hypothetical protein